MKKTLLLLLLPFFIACTFGEGGTPLMKASKDGNIEQVKQLVNEKSIDKISAYGWTALMFASGEGHEDIVKLLLEKGANPNIRSGEIPAHFETTGDMPSTTALGTAIEHNHISVAKILMDNGALIDRYSIAQMGATGDIGLAKLMLKKGADLDTSSHVSYYPSALCTASRDGKLEMVKFLIDNGVNPNKIHHNRYIALEKAVFQGRVEVVKYLLEHNANPNIVLDEKNTVLYTAITSHVYMSKENYPKHYEVLKLLLQHGADRFFKPYKGEENIVDKSKKKYLSFQKNNTANKQVSQHLLKVMEIFEFYDLSENRVKR